MQPVAALPSASAVWAHQNDVSRLDERGAQVLAAALRDLPQDRPPTGTVLSRHQSQARKSRPRSKASPLPIATTIAVEIMGPMPGMLINRWQLASWCPIVSISHRRIRTNWPGPRRSLRPLFVASQFRAGESRIITDPPAQFARDPCPYQGRLQRDRPPHNHLWRDSLDVPRRPAMRTLIEPNGEDVRLFSRHFIVADDDSNHLYFRDIAAASIAATSISRR